MAEYTYRVLIAKDREGIIALAGDEWTILESTVKEFKSLDSNDDLSFGDIGGIDVDSAGFVALARK